jgi:tetratricopeptide (TPR) repeat protein
MLSADRWRRAREVFDAVVDLPSPDRERRLDALCEDAELRLEVVSLLSHDRPDGDTLDDLVADAAAEAAGSSPWRADDPPATIGRYRVLEKLGEGGMGEVFLAEDTSLGRRVALKLPPVHLSGDERIRQRLLQEARAAATLNHPHVCIVHEVGEGADGRPFIAMEHVHGETLAARIRRGPLPAGEVIAIGRQAASALQAAHAMGVVHRDLKPSNMMLTSHGIKLLDFGLASAARDSMGAGQPPLAAGFAGTIPYMSPEQVRAEALDLRTDLFSLGVVLYEAATGRLPFEAPTRAATCQAILEHDPPPPSRLVANLPPAIDLVVMRALAKPRDARYQSAQALADDLAAGIDEGVTRAANVPSARARWLFAVAAAVALVSAGVAYVMRGVPAVGRAPVDATILLADFTNETGDAAFDDTLRQALVVQLQQTPFLRVFPQAGVQETLRQMTRPANTRLTGDVAQEITRRRGIHAWISGSIAPAGHGFAIALVATHGDSGDALARARVDAAGRVDVLPSLGLAATRLRTTLGESLQSIGQFNTPIQEATTASLDALKAYTLATRQADSGDYATAAALYQRAVQIDPEFAMGWQALARQQANGIDPREAIAASAARAYALRSRATEPERFAIEEQYHQSVTGDLERSVATGERWKAAYPRDWRSYHSLADLYFSLGQFAKARDAGREAVRLNPDVAAAYSNLAGALFALDRYDEAREVYRSAMARGLDAPEYHAFLWRIAYYTRDEEGLRRQSDWAAASSTWAFNMPALAAALQGRWESAQHSSREASTFFERRGMFGLVGYAARYEAMTGALVGDCIATRRSATRGSGPDRLVEEQARVMFALALCGDTSRTVAFVERLQRTHPEDTMLSRVWAPLVSAAAALRRGRPADAMAALDIARPYETAVESWPIYVRGLVLLEARAGAEAQIEFQKVIDHPGRTFWFPLAPLSRLGLARARAMAGDSEGARRAYEALFEKWPHADPTLPVLVQAREEHRRLSAAPTIGDRAR